MTATIATSEDDYSRCAPPVDTKFEGTFDSGGFDFVDMSLVDGWTLPFKLTLSGGECTGQTGTHSSITIDCSGLSFELCPKAEELTAAGITADLRAVNPHTKEVAGCYAPCQKLIDTKWNNSDAKGRFASDPEVAPYCCPTPPETPEQCRAGPITQTHFLEAVHQKCPGVYGYAYDDGMGLLQCTPSSFYDLTFYCPDSRTMFPSTTTKTTTTRSATSTETITITSTAHKEQLQVDHLKFRQAPKADTSGGHRPEGSHSPPSESEHAGRGQSAMPLWMPNAPSKDDSVSGEDVASSGTAWSMGTRGSSRGDSEEFGEMEILSAEPIRDLTRKPTTGPTAADVTDAAAGGKPPVSQRHAVDTVLQKKGPRTAAQAGQVVTKNEDFLIAKSAMAPMRVFASMQVGSVRLILVAALTVVGFVTFIAFGMVRAWRSSGHDDQSDIELTTRPDMLAATTEDAQTRQSELRTLL